MPLDKKSPDSVFFLGCPPNTEVLGEQPTNVRAMNLVARILMKEGKFEKASQRCREIIERLPDSPAAADAKLLLEQMEGK